MTRLSAVARAIATVLYTHAQTVLADARIRRTAGRTCCEIVAPDTEKQIANAALAVGVLETSHAVLAETTVGLALHTRVAATTLLSTVAHAVTAGLLYADTRQALSAGAFV